MRHRGQEKIPHSLRAFFCLDHALFAGRELAKAPCDFFDRAAKCDDFDESRGGCHIAPRKISRVPSRSTSRAALDKSRAMRSPIAKPIAAERAIMNIVGPKNDSNVSGGRAVDSTNGELGVFDRFAGRFVVAHGEPILFDFLLQGCITTRLREQPTERMCELATVHPMIGAQLGIDRKRGAYCHYCHSYGDRHEQPIADAHEGFVPLWAR